MNDEEIAEAVLAFTRYKVEPAINADRYKNISLKVPRGVESNLPLFLKLCGECLDANKLHLVYQADELYYILVIINE